MLRLRRSRRWSRRTIAALAETYAERRPPTGGPWPSGWDFEDVNEQIDKHNRWFPLEARLPMDPKTRDFVTVGGSSYRRDPLDAAWILARFPA